MGFESKMVKDSFELAKPIAERLIKRFYENLFTDYPQSKSLYIEGQLPEQQLALLKALNFIIENLENKETLSTFLKTLNERYSLGLGDPLTNQWVRSSFLKTLSEAFGSDWNSELAEQWQMAYQMVTSFFQDSFKSQKPTTSQELGKVLSFPVSSNAQCDLPTAVKNHIREEARKTVYSLLHQEYQAALDAEIEGLTTDIVKSVILRKVA
jgi:hemoglobin-like flavoprotein